MIGCSKKTEASVREKAFKQKTMKPKLKLDPGLALIGRPTAGPRNPTDFHPQIFSIFINSLKRDLTKDVLICVNIVYVSSKCFFGLPKLRQRVSEFQCPRLYLQRQNRETSSRMKLQGYVVCTH